MLVCGNIGEFDQGSTQFIDEIPYTMVCPSSDINHTPFAISHSVRLIHPHLSSVDGTKFNVIFWAHSGLRGYDAGLIGLALKRLGLIDKVVYEVRSFHETSWGREAKLEHQRTKLRMDCEDLTMRAVDLVVTISTSMRDEIMRRIGGKLNYDIPVLSNSPSLFLEEIGDQHLRFMTQTKVLRRLKLDISPIFIRGKTKLSC